MGGPKRAFFGPSPRRPLGRPRLWVDVFLPFDRDSNGRCCQNRFGPHFGVAPPILEPILVGIGMFTGGTGF